MVKIMNYYKKILIAILLLPIFIYFLIVNNTNSIIYDFKNCIKCNDISQEISSTELYRYYYDDFQGTVADADVNIKRIFVFHNFNKGIMYVKYSCEKYDQSGNHLYGSSNVYAKWYIEKNEGRWVVVKVEENP